MNNFLKVMCLFLGIPVKEKEELNPGVLGYYDCKPYHNFHYALLYAKDIEVYNDEKIEIYTRIHKGTTFVNVLVNDEEDFKVEEFDYPHLRKKLMESNLENTDKSVVFIAFQHNNEKTINFCKKLPASTKYSFIQGAVFNPKSIHMDFYKPVPEFYKLYDHFCEDLYFDFAFIDHVKES